MFLSISERAVDGTLDQYLHTVSSDKPHQLADMGNFAAQLQANGSDAFQKTPLNHVVAIPLGEHTVPYFERTLDVLATAAKQAPYLPSVMVSINYPERSSRKWRSKATLGAITIAKAAQQQYGDTLPLSYYTTGYQHGTSIGIICDDLFGAAAVLHQRREHAASQPVRDILMTRWDGDTLDATPTYLADAQNAYAVTDRSVWVGHPHMRHERLDDTAFPNANHLLAWFDLAHRAGKYAVPSHLSINLGGFALSGGFRNEYYGEHRPLLARAAERTGQPYIPRECLAYAVATNSAASIFERMSLGKRMEYVPMRADTSRSLAPTGLTADISPEWYNQQLGDFAYMAFMSAYYNKLCELTELQTTPNELAQPAAKRYASRYLRAGAFVMGSIHDTRAIVEDIISDPYLLEEPAALVK